MPPPAVDVAAVTALIEAQAATRDSLTTQATAIAAAATAEFDGWYDTAAITAWAARLAKRIEPIQRVLAQSTDASLARLISTLGGRRLRPAGRVDVTNLRPGMTHAGAYGNVADAYRWQQSKWDTAARTIAVEDPAVPPAVQLPLDAAVQRAASVAEMDSQLAVRQQSQQTMRASTRVVGYRRVIHPELTRTGTCGLCIAASIRIYRVDELMPIHHHCACSVVPLLAGQDLGAAINAADLGRVYRDAGSTGASDLKRTRYTVTDAGALGPLLEPEANARRLQRKKAGAGNPKLAKSPERKAADLARLHGSLEASRTRARANADKQPAIWADYADALGKRVADLGAELT